VTSRIFGYAHSFDLEELSSRINQNTNSLVHLIKGLGLVNQYMYSQAKSLSTFEEMINKQIHVIQRSLDELASNMDQVSKQTNWIQRSIIHVLLNKLIQDQYEDIIQSCTNHFVPKKLLQAPEYEDHLNQLIKNLTTHGLEILPSFLEKQHLLQYPLVSCLHQSSGIIISVSFPIRRMNMFSSHYRIELQPTLQQNSVCYLNLPQPLHVLLDKNDTPVIAFSGTEICSEFGSRRCLLQMNNYVSQDHQLCLSNVLSKVAYAKINESCESRCSSVTNTPLWVTINATTWGYYGPGQDITVVCSNQNSTVMSIPDYHLFFWVTIPCNCFIELKNKQIMSPGLWCDDALEMQQIPVIHISETNISQILNTDLNGLTAFQINVTLPHLNQSTILKDNFNTITSGKIQIESELNNASDSLTINRRTSWIILMCGAIGFVILSLILLLILKTCKSGQTSNLSVLGLLSYFIPGVKCETYFVIGTVVVTSFVQTVVLCVSLILVYKLMLTLKRRRSCHSLRAVNLPEVGRYHLDLLIPYPSNPLTVKVMNLSYPIHFYKPLSTLHTITVAPHERTSEIASDRIVHIETIWGKEIVIPHPIVIEKELPSYTGPGYFVFESH